MSIPSILHRAGLIRRSEGWSLSRKAWIGIIIVAIASFACIFNWVLPFLAVSERLKCELLVVEGWIPDYGLDEVRKEFQRGGYRLLVLTGNPIIKGEPLSEFKTFPELTRAILLKQGWPPDRIVAVPSGETHRDRTFGAALALRSWLLDAEPNVRCVNVFSRGSHARRTRLLYEIALRGVADVGIIAGTDLRYDSRSWWKSSEGVRDIIDETIAYLYARFVFRPS
jgi:hypothetical protein